MSDVTLWVRPEVMELGVVNVVPANKISIEMLSKLLQYTKDLGNKGYPKLSYDTWKHIAVKKMGLTVECAMVIFFSCLLFSRMDNQSLQKFEVNLASNPPQKTKDDVLGKMEVWTLELIILLYLHRVSNTHPRAVARQASLQSLTTDPWPSESNNSNIRKQLPEEQNASFIKDSLPELLSLLSGHLQPEDSAKKNSEKRNSRELLSFMRSAGVLTIDVVKSLGFIIGASVRGERQESTVLDLATTTHTCYQSGYLSKKNAFQKGLFEQWLLRGLDWAPHGEWLCVRKGKRLSWPIVSLSHSSHHLVATSPPVGHDRMVCVSDLYDGMTAHIGEEAATCDIRIRKCNKSSIYVLQPLRHVIIHKCHDSKIVLGPASGRVKISECWNMTVTCPARSIVVCNSRGITIHTLVPQRPLLVGIRTNAVTLGPLNIHYNKLRQHLTSTGLQTHINLWNKPLHLEHDGSVITGTCDIMSADDFHLHAVPFVESASPVDGRPPLVPPGLSSDFIRSIEAARKRVSSFRSELQDADLTPEQKLSLQKAIDSRFKMWLKDTNKKRELDQLEKLATRLKYDRITKQTTI